MPENFTRSIYDRTQFHKGDALRHQMLKDKCKDGVISANMNIDPVMLPNCCRSLKQHVRRANYQTGIWKRVHQTLPEILNPTEGHGWVLKDGTLVPLWTEEEDLVFYQQVIYDLLSDAAEVDDEELRDCVE